MEKELKLYSNYGKFDENTFVVADNDTLKIKISSELRNGVNYYAIITKDKLITKLLIENGVFEIPDKFLTYGIVNMTITSVLNGVVLKEFVCDKLIIREIRKQAILIPEIENLKIELAECKNKYENQISALEKEIKQIKGIEGVGL